MHNSPLPAICFEDRFKPMREFEARNLQRTGAAVSKANREGKGVEMGWQFNPIRAKLAYADARMYMGVNDEDQFYA